MASGAFRRVPFSDHAVFTLLDRYPGIRDSLSWSMSLKGRQSTVQLYAALHFLLSRIDPKVTVDLLERSCDITRQKKSGDAAKSLRDVLMTLGGTGFRVEQEALCACVVKAWNAVRTPGRPGVIKWKEGENFPEISGWTDAVALDVSEAIGRAAAKTGDDKVRFKKLVKVDGRNMVARLVHITPELARRLLELNGTNRKIAARHVDKYARDMAALRWLVNGETIKFSGDANIFDKDGQFVPSLADVTRLIDGQHRLNACVQSGRSFNAIVVTGLRETAFEGLDRGAKKSFGHYLGERGYGHAAAMAGAARLIFDFESSRLKNRVDPSNAELDDVVERHAGLEKPPELLKRGPSMVFPSTFWAAYVLFGENNAERAKNGLIPPGSDPLEDFFTKFATGAGLEVGSPVLALRNRLTESVRLGNTSGEKTHNYQQLKYLVAAWNDYVCGRNKKSYNMSVALQEDCQSIVLPTVKFKRVAPKA
jgi:hypothetical protein